MDSLDRFKNNFGKLFCKDLTDIIRGLRNCRGNNESKFIANCLDEIRGELKDPDINVKAGAVLKLFYLQMLGHDISWAAFSIIEIMSSEKFTFMRIGYLAGSQCLNGHELLMLIINLMKRNLCDRNQYVTGCAIGSLSCFVSQELGQELIQDVLRLFSSTKPYLRKRAIVAAYKITTVYPEATYELLPKLEEKLEDPDQGVQSSVINVICELARKNPKDFLHLEGTLYKLMENSSNNWMLIKIIKLFGSLTPLDPKVGEKLIQPLENLAHSTSAMSVLYETISTMMSILASPTLKIPKTKASAYRQLCVQKLRLFIEDNDMNLKYLGLLAMKKMSQISPKSVRAHQDIIIGCLEDKDESIRLRALDLLYGMVSKDNLTTQAADGIIDRLMKHVSYPKMGNKFRDEIVFKVIDICSRDDYFYITNFDWYITVLVTLASIEGGTSHGNLIAQQLLDVAVRVKEVRSYAIKQMAAILRHTDKFSSTFSVTEVLYAASWICGEYSELLNDKIETMYNLLGAKNFAPYILAIFVQNACKIFSRLSQEIPREELIPICDRLLEKDLPSLVKIEDLEVQERVSNFINIVELTKSDNIDFSKMFYAYTLNPVTTQAQSKVQIPADLDLDEVLHYDPESPLSSDDDDEDDKVHNSEPESKPIDLDAETTSYVSDSASAQQNNNIVESTKSSKRDHDIHYLKGEHKPYNPPPMETDVPDNQAYNAMSSSVHEESGLYTDNFGPSSPIQADLDRAVEAINLSDTHKVKDFTSIPGLTSYNDFLKTRQPTAEKPVKEVKEKVKKAKSSSKSKTDSTKKATKKRDKTDKKENSEKSAKKTKSQKSEKSDKILEKNST